MSQPPTNDVGPPVEGLSPVERDLEATLSRLRFSSGNLDDSAANAAGVAFRDRLMFRAGEAAGIEKERRAAKWQVWGWRGVAAAMAAITVAIGARDVAPGRMPAQIVYVQVDHPSSNSAGVAVGASMTRRASDLPPDVDHSDRADGSSASPNRAGGAPSVTLIGDWPGVRDDYLSTRAAVLRWGVAALPSERGNDSSGRPDTGLKPPTLLDLIRNDEDRSASTDRESVTAPLGRLERLKQWISNSNGGGRL